MRQLVQAWAWLRFFYSWPADRRLYQRRGLVATVRRSWHYARLRMPAPQR